MCRCWSARARNNLSIPQIGMKAFPLTRGRTSGSSPGGTDPLLLTRRSRLCISSRGASLNNLLQGLAFVTTDKGEA